MRPRALALLLVAAGLAPVPAAHASLRARYQLEPPLPAPVPFGITEGGDGTLWVASTQGLYRHDGEAARIFDPSTQPLLKSSIVRHVVTDSSGAVWAATGGGVVWDGAGPEAWGSLVSGVPGLFRIEGDEWRRIDARAGLPPLVVWSLAARGRSVWIGAQDHLVRWREGQVALWGAPAGLADGPVLAVAVPEPPADAPANGDAAPESSETVLVGTPSGLYRLRDGRFERIFERDAVLAVEQDPDGRIWIGTPHGLRVSTALPASGSSPLVVDASWPRMNGLPSDVIRALAFDGAHHLWAATAAGVCRVDVATPVCLSAREGLLDPRPTALGADRQGGLWVGMQSGGLQRVLPTTVSNFGVAEGLPAVPALAVLVTRAGVVWASTPAGVVQVSDRGVAPVLMPPGTGTPQARSLAEGADGTIWVGTTDRGLLQIKPGQAAPATRAVVVTLDDAPSTSVRSVLADPDGTLWLSWAGGGTSRGRVVEPNPLLRGAHPRFEGRAFTLAEGTCPGEVTVGVRTHDGRHVFASYGGGLTEVEGDRVRCFGTPQGIPSLSIVALHEDKDGQLWLGLDHDGGLVRLRHTPDGRLAIVQRLLEPQGVACNSIFEIAEDAADNLWLACGGGVQRVAKRELSALFDGKSETVNALRFRTWNGVRSPETTFWGKPVGDLAPDGRFWIATPLGLSAVEVPVEPPALGPALIASLMINGQPMRRDAATVSGRSFTIEARLRVGGFMASGATRFRYRLLGYSSSFREVDGPATVAFTGVKPGDYQLEVLAGDPYRGWTSNLTRVDLRLRPPFWRTLWFAVIAAAAVLLAILLGYLQHWFRRRARRAARRIERERIARDLHDGIGQGFSSIGFLLEALREHMRQGPAPARELVESARITLNQARAEARRLVWNLRGSEEEPLERALPRLVRSLRAQYRLPIIELRLHAKAASEASGPVEVLGVAALAGASWRASLATPTPLPTTPGPLAAGSNGWRRRREPYVDHELLQVAREALTNAIEHADARLVRVALEEDDDAVVLTIADDGVGIEPEVLSRGRPGHFGLRGMRERARLLGGEMKVDSRPGEGPGHGTVVVVRVPLGRPGEITAS